MICFWLLVGVLGGFLLPLLVSILTWLHQSLRVLRFRMLLTSCNIKLRSGAAIIVCMRPVAMTERIIMRDGNFLSGQLFDVADVRFFVGLAEGDRVPGCSGASRASDAMYIRFRDVRNFVVDDVLQIVNIYSTRGDVGRNKYA